MFRNEALSLRDLSLLNTYTQGLLLKITTLVPSGGLTPELILSLYTTDLWL